MVYTSLPGGKASPRRPLVAEEQCLLAQVAHQARHRRCQNSHGNNSRVLTPMAPCPPSLVKAPAQENITGAGSVALSQPLLLFQALPAGAVPREEPLLRSCCYIKNEEGLELLRQAGGDVRAIRLPDFSALPGISDAKVAFKLPHRKASLFLPSLTLLRGGSLQEHSQFGINLKAKKQEGKATWG